MRISVIHYVAKLLGILVHIEGLPYGSSRNIDFSQFSGEVGRVSSSNEI